MPLVCRLRVDDLRAIVPFARAARRSKSKDFSWCVGGLTSGRKVSLGSNTYQKFIFAHVTRRKLSTERLLTIVQTDLMKNENRSVLAYRLSRLASVCAALMAFPSFLAAQTSAPVDGDRKDEVLQLSPFIVSTEQGGGYQAQQTMVGSRSAKALLDIPASVSIINLEQITDLNAVELYQVIKYTVSGVTQNASIGDDINIRGFRLGGRLRDGVLSNNWAPAPMYDVERIEVLRGPGAMLTGNNTGIGGSINFVSRKPTAKPAAEIQTTFSDHNYVRLQANVSGPLVKQDDFALNYRVTVGGLTGDREKEIENQDEKYFGAALAMYFGSHTSIHLDGYFYDQDSYLYANDFLDITLPVDPVTGLMKAKLNSLSTESFSPGRSKDGRWSDEQKLVSLTMLTKLTDNSNLRALYSFQNMVYDERYVRGITVQSDNFTLNRQEIPTVQDNFSHNVQLDYLHQLAVNSWFKMDTSFGFDGSRSKSRQQQSVNAMPALDTRQNLFPNDDAYFSSVRPGSGLPNLTRNEGNTTAFSYYVQENLSFWKDRVLLIGGLRWFKADGDNTNFVTNAFTKRATQSFDVHKYGVVVKVLPNVSLYYTDAQNIFLQSGFTDKLVANDGLGAPLGNQQGKLREFGLKFTHHYSDAFHFYGTITNFDMAMTNVRTFGTLESGQQGIIQSERDTGEGWEVELGAQLKFNGGKADLYFTYFDGNSAIASDAGRAYVRQAANFVPTKYSVMARYSWTDGALKGFMIGGGLMDQTASRNGVHEVNFPLTASVFSRYRLNKHWDFQFNIDNLTDKRYVVNVYGTGLVGVSEPLRARATVKYTW